MAFPGLIRIFLGKTTNNLIMQRSAFKNCFHKKCATESPKIKPVEDPPRARKLVVGETEAGTSYGTERNGTDVGNSIFLRK